MIKSLQTVIKRLVRIIFAKRAISNTVSVTVLAGAVIALSLTVFAWAQNRSSDYNSEFSEMVTSETARLKEQLAFEYVVYDENSNNLTVFLLNCGTVDGIRIRTIYVYDSSNSVIEIFSNPILYSFQSLSHVIPGQVLDIGEEGRLVLLLEVESGFYNIRVVTQRGATFDSGFVA